jgi:hypothetical protein
MLLNIRVLVGVGADLVLKVQVPVCWKVEHMLGVVWWSCLSGCGCLFIALQDWRKSHFPFLLHLLY